MSVIRLNKYLKDQGICSRRKADEFIEKGYIKVNGKIVTELGYKLDSLQDKVEVLAEVNEEKAKFKYILLNKPRGYVCSKNKIEGKTIFELLPKIEGLTYAGRLDKESSGLIILSNDGKFTYSIFGNEFEREKEYEVKVNKPLTKNYIYFQRSGIIKLDGRQVKKAKVIVINEYSYRMILTEGIHRQIRRMAENQGYKVIELHRLRIDEITEDNLPLGKWRELSQQELNLLKSKNNA